MYCFGGVVKCSVTLAEDNETACSDGVDYAREKDLHVIVRGLRAITDFEYELQMAQTNRVLEPEVDTTFLITSLEYAYLSSTVVKEVAAFGGDIHKFVPDFVEKEIRAKYAARNSEGMPQDKR